MKDETDTASAVEEIVEFNRQLKPRLVRLKYLRMSHDFFAFFRGTDHLFASAWPRLHPPDLGPAILICGDLHLENFGVYRSEHGILLYDVNDFDEALVAPCSLDLVRCATSILLAAELWKFTPFQALRSVLSFLDRYRAAVTESVSTGTIGEVALGSGRGPIWSLLCQAARGSRAEFLARHTEKRGSAGRRIRRIAGRYHSLGRQRADQIREALGQYGHQTPVPEFYQVLDVASRVAGIGSLGLRRYAVLVAGGKGVDRYRILDIKEARGSSLRNCTEEIQPDTGVSDALRIVRAQRRLQARPAAHLDVIQIGEQMYRMRELIPEERRASLDCLKTKARKFRRAAAVAGRLTGWAHVRGARSENGDRTRDLAAWASGPGLDSVIASAIRYFDLSRRQHHAFRRVASDKEFLHSIGR